MKNGIVESKINLPRISSTFVCRLKLLERFQEGKKLYILNANVGHGKTVLMTQFAEKFEGICAWYHLGKDDNDIITFIQYLEKAINRVNNDFSFDWETYGSAVQDTDFFEDLMYDFSSTISRSQSEANENLAIVLDDFQIINNEKVFRLVEHLLIDTSDRIRFFIATKEVLPQFLTRHLLGEIAEVISQKELCFELRETEKMLEQFAEGEALEAIAKEVHQFTEGWPAGVMFVVLYGKQSGYIAPLGKNQTFYEKSVVHGYMMHEIYKKLPYDIQQFLTVTSALDFLSSDICNVVVGVSNSSSILDYLTQSNMFVSRVGNQYETFRYHSLFKDFLSETLREETKKEVLDKAAEFYLGTENKEQAVEYAMRNQNTNLVQYAMESIGVGMLNKGKLDTLENWIDYLTASKNNLTSQNTLICGMFFYRKGNAEKALSYVEKAKDMFLSAMDERGYIYAMLEKACITRNCISLEASNQIIEEIMPRLRNKNSNMLFVASRERLYNLIFLGRYMEALGVCSEAILTARRNGNKKAERQFAQFSLMAYFYMGNYEKAMKLYNEFSEVENFMEDDGFSVNPYAAMLLLLYGKPDEAKILIDRELEQKINQKKREDIWLIHLFRACIYALLCNLEWRKSGKPNEALYKQALKSADIAEKHAGYWVEKHVFTGYIQAIKSALVMGWNLDKSEIVPDKIFLQWKDVYPFARDFAISYHLMALNWKKIEIDQENFESFIPYIGNRRNLFTIYIKGLYAIKLSKNGETLKAEKLAEEVESYTSENKITLFFMADAEQILLKKLSGAEKVLEIDQEEKRAELMEVHSMGAFEVYVHGQPGPIKWRTKKAMEMFAFLYHMNGEPVLKEKLLLQLWPESNEKSGTDLLHSTLYSIRKVLSDVNVDKLVEYKGKKYFLNMEMISSQRTHLERLSKQKDKNEEIYLDEWINTMELYKGSYMENIDCSFCIESRTYYEQEFLKLCITMAERSMKSGNYEIAIRTLTKALELDMYDEDLYVLLIECYGTMGNIKGAKQTYSRMKKVFSEELGIEPGENAEAALKKFISLS